MTPYYEADGITIYLGDARDLAATLPDASIDLVFTDPPYGHNNNNNGDLIHRREAALGKGEVKQEDARPIENDSADEANALVQWLFRESARLLRPGHCCCCCCCGGGPDPQFARWSLWMDEALAFKQMVVWDKGPMGMGWHYRRSYETILVGYRSGAAVPWGGGMATENIIRPGAFGVRKIIPSAKDHPTPKPPALAAHFLRLHSLPSELVFDPFMGAGSTLIAAKMMGRRAVGCDVSEAYCEIAVKKLAQRELPLTRGE